MRWSELKIWSNVCITCRSYNLIPLIFVIAFMQNMPPLWSYTPLYLDWIVLALFTLYCLLPLLSVWVPASYFSKTFCCMCHGGEVYIALQNFTSTYLVKWAIASHGMYESALFLVLIFKQKNSYTLQWVGCINIYHQSFIFVWQN